MKAGFYLSSALTMAQYLADPCDTPSLSSGAAHTLLTRSPAHVFADHPRLGGRQSDDSHASDIGSVAHDHLLGGEGKICVIDPNDYPAKNGNVPDGYTNPAIRAARDQARDNGLTPILAGAMAGARNMALAAQTFLAESEIAGVLSDGEGEVTQLWQENGGVWCRARHDWVNQKMKIRLSYKTTQASAAPAQFIRGVMAQFGYATALMFYARGFQKLTKPDPEWRDVILCQEQASPNCCSLISLDPAMTGIADANVERAINIWRECMRTDRWPAYSNRIHYAEPTPWQLAEAEMQS